MDENGDLVDGDKIMYIIGKYLSEKGELAQKYHRDYRHV